MIVSHRDQKEYAEEAWKQAVKYLQMFRQGIGVGRDPGKKNEKGEVSPGRSRWPEPDSIRTIVATSSKKHSPIHNARISFPRAAFGLPIVFKFKDDRQGDPHQTQLMPVDGERLASPLILTAYPLDNGAYAPAALLLPHGHLRALNLELSYSGSSAKLPPIPPKKEDEWHARGWDEWPENWWENKKAGDVPPIASNLSTDSQGSDTLTAFKNFFQSGGSNR